MSVISFGRPYLSDKILVVIRNDGIIQSLLLTPSFLTICIYRGGGLGGLPQLGHLIPFLSLARNNTSFASIKVIAFDAHLKRAYRATRGFACISL
jgi:hypothetical protein